MCCIDYANAFDCVNHIKLWKTLQETGFTMHLIKPIANSYRDVGTEDTGGTYPPKIFQQTKECPFHF